MGRRAHLIPQGEMTEAFPFALDEELPLKLMQRIWHNLKAEREEGERQAHPQPGTCWQCRGDTFTDSVECRVCHESYSRPLSGKHV
jgi:hypothetical protein